MDGWGGEEWGEGAGGGEQKGPGPPIIFKVA